MKTASLRKCLILLSVLLWIPAVFLPGMAEDGLAQKVEAAEASAEYKANGKTHRVIYHVETELTNHSDTSLMEIQYRIHFLDENGEELGQASPAFNGQDAPLEPGESFIDYRSGQFESDGIPAGIRYEILKVSTEEEEEEMPPIHVPQPGELLYQALSDKNLQNILEEPPVFVELWVDHGGAGNEGILENAKDIAEFTEAFTQIRIEEETDEWVTDNYNGLSMTFANGESFRISLNLSNLEYPIYGEWHIFKLTDDGPFWQFMYEAVHPAEYGEEYGGS